MVARLLLQWLLGCSWLPECSEWFYRLFYPVASMFHHIASMYQIDIC